MLSASSLWKVSTPVRDSWGARLVWCAAGVAALALSLGLRVWHRGPYAPGWDFIGGATGLWLWSTRSPSDVLAWTWEHAFRTCRAANCRGPGDRIWYWNLYGLSVVPGMFAAWVPWLWWPHVWTAAVSTLVYGFLWRATRAPVDVMLLAIASSGLLLSWSLMGLLYVSCLLPHAIALWTIQCWRHRPGWSAAFATVACALSWQGQELGQLVMVPLVAATICCRDAPTITRLILGAIGVAQFGLVVAFPTHNIAGHWQWPTLGSVSIAHATAATTELPDTIALTAIGIVAAIGLRGRERWFWRIVLLTSLGAVLWLMFRTATPQAYGVGGLWPRRYLLADFYLLAVTLEWGAERVESSGTLGMARVVLLGAALLQVARTVAWSREPLPIIRAGQVASLPHTTTRSSIDLFVHRPSVDRALEWISQIRRGEDVSEPYSCKGQRENETDPQAVLSRVYLAVGHEAFRRHMKGLDREGALCLPLSIETR